MSRQIEGTVEMFHEIRVLICTAETRKDIDSWLGATWTNTRYDECLGLQLVGTGDWIFNIPAFLEWSSPAFPANTAKLLWINGPAGHGKTITCARVIEYLSKTLELPLVYYFYSSDYDMGDPFVIVRSWISQMMASNSQVFELASDRWQIRNGPTASRKEVTELFGLIVQAIPNCTFVVDGLDECVYSKDSSRWSDDNSRSGFIKALKHTVAYTTSRIMIVSRDEADIRNAISATTSSDQSLVIYEHRITQEDVKHDLLLYSESTIRQSLPDRTKIQTDELSRWLTEGSSGMFLWVKLQGKNLERRGKGKNNKQLGRMIQETPRGLDHLYERNWDEIDRLEEPDRTRALSILRWAALATRPLTVREITESLLVADDDNYDDLLVDELPDALDEAYVDGQIIGICASLVEKHESATMQSLDTMTIHLTHFSVKEYVLWKMSSSSPRDMVGMLRSSEAIQHNQLAKICLRYLNFKNVWQYPGLSKDLSTSRSFRLYAATSWYQHIMVGAKNYPEVVRLINVLFNPANQNWEAWRNSFDTTAQLLTTSKSLVEGSSTCPLYYASHLGLYDTALYLLEEVGLDPNHIDDSQTTALHAACIKGHHSIVKALLKRGASITIADNYQRTPLYLAAMNGNCEVVKTLLKVGANLAVPQKNGWTPLNAASNNGHIEVVKLLLDNGADLTIANNNSWTPLNTASNNGHVEVIKLLLENGADLTIANNGGWTPLNIASNNGHIEVVRLLLDNGADLTIANNIGCTPLYWASYKGHIEVVKLLLENGADLTIANNDGWTPFNSASNNGHIEVVKLLLENGADLTVANKIEYTPLYSASRNGHVEVVELLLKNGADLEAVNAKTLSRRYGTLLNSSAHSGSLALVCLWLDKFHFDYNSVDDQGRNAAHFAARGGHTDVLAYLLELGIHPDARDVKGDGILQYATMSGSLDTVRKALSVCGPHESVTGWTPLHWACRMADFSMVNLLVTSGVANRVTTTYQPPGQWTPYSIATYHQNTKLTPESFENSEGEKNQQAIRLVSMGADNSVLPAEKHGSFTCDECLLVRISYSKQPQLSNL